MTITPMLNKHSYVFESTFVLKSIGVCPDIAEHKEQIWYIQLSLARLVQNVTDNFGRKNYNIWGLQIFFKLA